MEPEVHLCKTDVEHIDKRLDEIVEEIKNINGAFARNADGSIDHSGHRQYHESMIRAAEAQTAFWNELKLEIAKKGVWFLLVVICGFIVLGIQAKLGMK